MPTHKLARRLMPAAPDAPPSYLRRACRRAAATSIASTGVALLLYAHDLPLAFMLVAGVAMFGAFSYAMARYLLAVASVEEARERADLDGDGCYQALRMQLGLVPADELDDVRRQLATLGYVEINGRWQRLRRESPQPVAGELNLKRRRQEQP
jgi:hypothetical protein